MVGETCPIIGPVIVPSTSPDALSFASCDASIPAPATAPNSLRVMSDMVVDSPVCVAVCARESIGDDRLENNRSL